MTVLNGRVPRALSLAILGVASLAACAPDPASPPALISDVCTEHLAGGMRPRLLNARLAADTTPLCLRGFAILYSAVSRTPVYAAEHLTGVSLGAARGLDRVDDFHEEPSLPWPSRSTLWDYAGSGYDRGHMAPSADMADDVAQWQSFSLANIVPQDPDNNRGLWSDIESATRAVARRRGELYVVTGPIFAGGTVSAIKGRVLVPTQLFKALYDPASRTAAAYLAPNAAGRAWRAITLDELRGLAGLDPFPGVSVEGTMRLPAPRERQTPRREHERSSGWFDAMLHGVLRSLWRDLLRVVLG